MKVSGFTFIRNAIKLNYPIVEAITSILPVCDEVVVAVGKSEDETRQLIEQIDSDKIRIIDTEWDDSLRTGGQVLAEETNKAFRAISPDNDWAFYIQGDEVLHEKYLPAVRHGLEKNLNNSKVDGLLFNYLHFYGSYDYVGDAIKWYPKEIRIVRNRSDIYSFGDAQGFRKEAGKKLNVKQIDATIYHYGWVKPPKTMKLKEKSFHKYWHDDKWMAENIAPGDDFDYSDIKALWRFKGTHPKVMHHRVNTQNWKFEHDISRNTFTNKERLKKWSKKIFGSEFAEYKNYHLLR